MQRAITCFLNHQETRLGPKKMVEPNRVFIINVKRQISITKSCLRYMLMQPKHVKNEDQTLFKIP